MTPTVPTAPPASSRRLAHLKTLESLSTSDANTASGPHPTRFTSALASFALTTLLCAGSAAQAAGVDLAAPQTDRPAEAAETAEIFGSAEPLASIPAPKARPPRTEISASSESSSANRSSAPDATKTPLASLTQNAAASTRTASASGSEPTPEAAPFSPASESPSVFVRAEHTAPALVFRVAPGSASRIAVASDRILSAVWEKRDLDIQTESRSGELFVLPKRLGRIHMFVTTASGETAAIALEVDPQYEPQNIVLERRETKKVLSGEEDRRSTEALAPMPVSDYEAAVKRLVRVMATGIETPDVMKRTRCPAPSAALQRAMTHLERLKPVETACWSTHGMRGTEIAVRHTGLTPVLVREPALIGPKVLAIGGTGPLLQPGARGAIYFVEAADD